MWHTLAEATQLTGRSRRSLYRDMDAGRVSYRVRDDGRRELETSELIRAYGHLKGLAREAVPEAAQADIGDGTPSPITEETALRLIAAIERLVEVEEKKLLLIEHRPVEAEKEGAEYRESEQRPKEAATFADLLDMLSGK